MTGGKDAFEKGTPIGRFLMDRRYTCIRALPPSEVGRNGSKSADWPGQTETTEQIQRRLVKELYETVEEWTNEDMK